jgi:Putative Ig domain/Matrixin/Ig-like domain from next to BRCA1 gene
MTRFFKPAGVKFFVLIIGLLAAAQIASATTIVPMSDDEMLIGARAIVTGKVLRIESGFDAQQDRIYTYITVKVQQVLKGQISERRIVLKELGGQVGNQGLTVWGNPQFKRGERVLLYLDTWKDGSLRTYQMCLGKFSVVQDAATGHEYVQRDESDENTAVLRPQSLSEQPGRTITDRMELSSYLRMVSDRLAVNRQRSEEFQQTYYGNIPLNARPADYQKLAGHGEIHPEWTYISGAHPRWFEPDSGLPVTFVVNTDQAPNAQIMDDIAAAMNCWSSVPGTSLRIVSGGTTSICREGSGNNLILFNACDGRWSAGSGCSGVLALGGLGWNGNSRIINGVTYLQAQGGFISFNPFASCSFGNHCNVREITTHEMGHAMGLGHSTDPSATMYAFAHFDGRCATVMPDDIAGITTIYPGAGGGGTPLSISTTSLPNGTVGALYTATLQATGGTLPYSWSVTSGALPAGLSLNAATGTISGTPSTAATSNFTVQVQDSASPAGSATKALAITINASGGGTFSSQFISQNVPTTLQPGQTFNAHVVWLNTGSATWNDALGGLRLLSQNPPNNTIWGGNTVLLPGFVVAPGEQLDLTFQAIAPTTPGTYNFQWIVASNANSPFGQASTNVVIQVGSGGGGTNNAGFVSQTVPTTMTTSQPTPVSLTFSNTGTTTWTPGTYVLSSMNPTGNTTWGLSQVALTSSVAPGQNVTFNFNVIPPAVAGNYNFQWGMAQIGVGTFGTASTNLVVAVSSGTTGGPNAQFLLQNLPATWVAGQTYTVTISMKNTGTVAWTTSTFKLASQSPADNMNWGRNRVVLSKSILPGVSVAFSFTVTAPTTAGTYNFQWQMIQEGVGFFGDITPNKPFTVGGGGTNNAAFVSQSVATTMTTGQSVPVSLTFNNTGTTTWAVGTYVLGSRGPDGNTTWGLSQVALPSSVAPGQNATFSFNVTAPTTAGTYTFQWGMKQGSTYFGTASPATSVNVTSGGGGTNNASFVSQTVPATMTTGQSTSVTVTMNNNGSTTWAAGTYSLQSQAGSTWGISRVNVASPIAPGSNGVFTFTITAPATAGTYNFQWRMAQDSVGAFGSLSTNVAIVVSSGGGGTPLTITTAALLNGTRGVFYSQQIVATGGRQPYTWSSSGVLPIGLTLNASTGVLSGTPTAAAGYNFTVTVRDADGQTASKTFKILIK